MMIVSSGFIVGGATGGGVAGDLLLGWFALGHVVGADLMGLDWSTGVLFQIAAVPAGIAVVAMLAFWQLVKLPRYGESSAAALQTVSVTRTAPAENRWGG